MSIKLFFATLFVVAFESANSTNKCNGIIGLR